MPAPAPSITRIEPRGMQRGTEIKIKIAGVNLAGITSATFVNTNLTTTLLPGAKTNEAFIQVKAASTLARGAYEFTVKSIAGESGKAKLFVDDLPQVYESAKPASAPPAPVSFWGTLDTPGRPGQFEFFAAAGQTIVCDLAAESLGSTAKNCILTLLDARGNVLAVNHGFDGGADPLLVFKAPATARYTVRVSDLMAAASKDHFYRLSVGDFPVVTGAFPLSVPPNSETDVELTGENLPPNAKARVKSTASGEVIVPVDASKFRARREVKVLVGEANEFIESEPNDTPATAMKISVPCAVNGRIWATRKGQTDDADLFRFDAKAGQTWIVETMAARRGSPMDTKIEILFADGAPVPRLLMQAVRDSYINFRPIDSNIAGVRLKNWEEMELNQFVWLNGEVCKIFRAPQGPDSDSQFYTIGGKRVAYFDTTATAHANEETCYVVEPHPVGAKIVQTGLPVFTVNYVNDDDGERKLGSDSKLFFTTPKDGAYLIRVTDSRGFGGNRFAYRLLVREPKPDFKVSLAGTDQTINRGSGKEFTVNADRVDGFDGDITVNITGVPAGFTVSTPVVIQAGHREAKGTLNTALDANAMPDAWAKVKVTATAGIADKSVTRDVNNFGKVMVGEKSKLYVRFEPSEKAAPASPDKPYEITITPGRRASAW
ncbi:MAG: hypothetical protein HY300_12775, partial [Verrucomicrobia bacterium]|nr:hypothetical protein [Verrucomicrobiota bacterium]